MFACIYFLEDNSLSVVSRNDKNIVAVEKWERKEKVDMKWGKKIYKGTIIQTKDEADILNKFANEADKKVLRNKDIKKEDKEEKLLSFELNKPTGRRVRVETERLKESKAQEETSPKKTKKEKASTSEVPKRKENNKSTNKEKKNLKNRQEAVNLAREEEIIFSLSTQFSEPKETDKDSACPETTLTETWRLCNPDHDNVPSTQESRDTDTQIPVPAKVVQLFQLCLDPTVADFLRDVVKRQEKREDRIYLSLDTQKDELNTYTPCTQGVDQKQNYTCTSTLETFNTHQSAHYFNQTQTAPVFHPSSYQTPAPELITQQQSPYISYNQISSQTEYNLDRQPTYYSPTHTNTFSVETAQQDDLDTCVFPDPVIPPMKPIRRSPRKLYSTPIKTSSSEVEVLPPKDIQAPTEATSDTLKESDQKRTKLLGNREVTIDKEVLSNAVRLSKKSAKPAYTLTMKLLPGLFSCEEMANSRGQGIVAKKGDMRPPLDKAKVQALKDYVRCFCKSNGITEPSEGLMNEAITEKISYSRKLMRRQLHVTNK